MLGRERSLLRLLALKSPLVTLGYAMVVASVIVSLTVLLAFRTAVRGYLGRTLGMIPDAHLTLAAPVPIADVAAACAAVNGRHPGGRAFPVFEEELEIAVRWESTARGGREPGGASWATGVERRVRVQALKLPEAAVALTLLAGGGEQPFTATAVRPDFIAVSGELKVPDDGVVRVRDPRSGLIAGPYSYDRGDRALYALPDGDADRAGILALTSAVISGVAPVGGTGAFVSVSAETAEGEGDPSVSEAWRLHKLVFGPIDAGEPPPIYLSDALFDAFFESDYDYRTLLLEASGRELLTGEAVGHFRMDLPAGTNNNVLVMRHDAATDAVHRGRANGVFLMAADERGARVAAMELGARGLAVQAVTTRVQLSASVAERLRRTDTLFHVLAGVLILVAGTAAVTLLQRLGAMCRDELFLVRLAGGSVPYALGVFGAVAAAGAAVVAALVVAALHARYNGILAAYYNPEQPFPLGFFLGVAAACCLLFPAGAALSAARGREAGRP